MKRITASLAALHRWLTPAHDPDVDSDGAEIKAFLEDIESYPFRSGSSRDRNDIIQQALQELQHLGPRTREIIVSNLRAI